MAVNHHPDQGWGPCGLGITLFTFGKAGVGAGDGFDPRGDHGREIHGKPPQGKNRVRSGDWQRRIHQQRKIAKLLSCSYQHSAKNANTVKTSARRGHR
jgi:hypothetical protein